MTYHGVQECDCCGTLTEDQVECPTCRKRGTLSEVGL